MELPLIGYKGYGVTVEDEEARGNGTPYVAEEVGQHGDLIIRVPGGFQGKIKVSYVGFGIFRMAEAVSLISICGIVVWSMFLWKRGKHEK